MGNVINRDALDYSSGKVSFSQSYLFTPPAEELRVRKRKPASEGAEPQVYDSAAVFPLDQFLNSPLAFPVQLIEFLNEKGKGVINSWTKCNGGADRQNLRAPVNAAYPLFEVAWLNPRDGCQEVSGYDIWLNTYAFTGHVNPMPTPPDITFKDIRVGILRCASAAAAASSYLFIFSSALFTDAITKMTL